VTQMQVAGQTSVNADIKRASKVHVLVNVLLLVVEVRQIEFTVFIPHSLSPAPALRHTHMAHHPPDEVCVSLLRGRRYRRWRLVGLAGFPASEPAASRRPWRSVSELQPAPAASSSPDRQLHWPVPAPRHSVYQYSCIGIAKRTYVGKSQPIQTFDQHADDAETVRQASPVPGHPPGSHPAPGGRRQRRGAPTTRTESPRSRAARPGPPPSARRPCASRPSPSPSAPPPAPAENGRRGSVCEQLSERARQQLLLSETVL
jgi:hypothetical protein